jgi:hypothetical protein
MVHVLLLLLQEWHIIGINTTTWRSRVLAPMPQLVVVLLTEHTMYMLLLLLQEWHIICINTATWRSCVLAPMLDVTLQYAHSTHL